jgi:hypothetical protein
VKIPKKSYATPFKDLINIDVPMFAASGNFGRRVGRQNIDTLPALLATPDFPLTTVGSADIDGAQSIFSQGGPHLTLYAVGTNTTCLLSTGSTPDTDRDGTSYATPNVAANVANLLSYDTVPFDTSDGNLVKNLREYLLSDKASWARVPDVPMIWLVFSISSFQTLLLFRNIRYADLDRNGVTEEHNPQGPPRPAPNSAPSSQAPTPTPAPPPPPPPLPPELVMTCNGVVTSKCVSREGLANNIQNEFRPEAIKQGGPDVNSGSIGCVYNPDTIEKVSIYLDIPSGSPIPTLDECKAHFLDLVDNCDGNDPNSPVNYKAGGHITLGTHHYHITPEILRQPASAGIKGSCDNTWHLLFNEYAVWGHGRESANNGEDLKQQAKGCALLPETWSFAYGLGDDGREWTAKLRTGALQKKCISHAMKTVSGVESFGCGGTG